MRIIEWTRWATVALALGIAGVAMNQPLDVVAASDNVKLSGCLIKGEKGSAGYLLTNAPADPSLQEASRRVEPSAIGTSGDYTQIFYWLDGDKDLEKHIGHQVEVSGDTRGALRDGEIKVDWKDRWTELTVKSDGRTMKANVPHTSLVADEHTHGDKKGRVIVQRVDVDHVQMLGARCS